MAKLILVEFNELSPTLLDAWMAAGLLPNFKHFYDQSQIFVTEADETDPVNLEPWIQWYSVHTGLPYREHAVFHLTDGPTAGHPDIWTILHKSGKRVWNCSSMNARGFSFPDSAFLPDPWCTTERAAPIELNAFFRFVSHHVQEYTNSNKTLTLRDNVEFVNFMLSHGLRPRTILAVLRQRFSELTTRGTTNWRRVSLLDKLQFDVFGHFFRSLRPDFSTFFVNSTAHLQHAYWRHMNPEAFELHPSPSELAQYKDAILFGYREMDSLLGDFMSLAGTETQLIFATALSQQPYKNFGAIGGPIFYRPRDVGTLLSTLGIRVKKILPVMTHQYLAQFDDQLTAEQAREKLLTLKMNGETIFGFDSSEPMALYFGVQIHATVEPKSHVTIGIDSDKSFDFYELFYRIEATKSGRHHPHGCLWINTGDHHRHDQRASILDIMPTILDIFSLPTDQFCGQSLLRRPRTSIAA